ncbi:MAG: hypothetical protein GY778_16185, partial [bacterium]|nr:hypothetical protein [bacterium]
LAVVSEDVRELLSRTGLAGAPIIPVSSVTGAGLDELREALIAAADGAHASARDGAFRLAIDRVFTVAGRGTVVTGSVLQGRVVAGDELELWPQGLPCRVRGLQSHAEAAETVYSGQRAALNLIGVPRERLTRGCELATPGCVRPTHVLDVRLRCLASAVRPIRSRGRVRLCLATREMMARVVTPTGAAIGPGETGYAQLRLAEPVVAAYGQRFIVRDETATRTVGGGTVLRCSPKRRRIRGGQGVEVLAALHDGDATRRVEEVLRFAGFDRPADLTLAAESGVPVAEVPDIRRRLAEAGRLVTLGAGSGVEVTQSALEAVADRAMRWLAQFHVTHPDEPGMSPDVLVGYLDRKSKPGLGRLLYDRLLATDRVKVQGRYACHPDHAPSMSAQDERILAALLEEFEAAGLQPPTLADLKVAKQTNPARIERLVKIAAATEQLVEVRHGMFLHVAGEEHLRRRVADIIRGGGDTSVSAIRQELGSTRKYVVPLMEYLDRIGFTRREGDSRVLCERDQP